MSTLCCQFLFFQLNGKTNTCTANIEQSESISHPNTNTHTHTNTQIIYIYIYIYTHTEIYVCKYLLEFLKNFPSPVCEVAGSKFPMIRCCLITKLHSVLFQKMVMNVHIILTQNSSAVGRVS